MLPVWLALCLLPILGGAERFNCRGRILGAYYADAKSGCKAFHVCVRVAGGGIRDFRFFCPPGTLFHQEAQTCTDWGDDDPLACPADIYDGQFDLYKIGSGFDTKKLSSPANRDEESEFGLQRAETGDRRSSQNNGASDLRAAHSSDFFSGQRDRGRDDPAPASPPQRTQQNQPQQQQQPQHNQPPQNQPQQQSAPFASRQSFRRPTTQRAPPSPTQHTSPSPSPTPQPSVPQQYDTKRKLVRKRPIYVSQSTPAPQTTFAQNTQQPQSFPEQAPQQPQQNQQQQQQYQKQSHNPHKQQQYQQQFQNQQKQQQYLQQKQQHQQKQNQQQHQQNQQQAQQNQQPPQQYQPQQNQQQQQQFQQQSQQQQPQQNFNRRVPQTKQTIPPVNVPPQYKDYKDEYVEVSRVTPKPNKYFLAKSPTPTPFSQSSPALNFNKNTKDGLVELYNYDAQSTPGLGSQNDNRPFKVRNGFSVSDSPREPDYARSNNINGNRGTPTTVDYSPPSRATTSTPAFKNYNSVSYEPEKNNYLSFSKQQNYFNGPTTTPVTTAYTTTFRPEPPLNLNTVAYNTNIGFGHTQDSNYAESDEDDGQYRPPQGEDDGQYRPELYERELLSGAHSLNIAASGNRLPEDQKPRGKTKAPFKTTPQNTQTTFKASQAPSKPASQSPYKPVSQTAAPRPFRPAPTPTSLATQRVPETYPTTIRPQTQPQTQRTFDYFQTYTTTSRPSESSAAPAAFTLDNGNNYSTRPTTVLARNPEPRQPSHAPSPPTVPPAPPAPPALRPTTRNPFFANVSNKEDNSYDYAYYDSDPGFSEYDHIEEFGKTKTKKA